MDKAQEKNVPTIRNTEDMDKERIAEIHTNLERMGLSAYFPEFSRNIWDRLDTIVVCGPQGGAVVCRNEWHRHIAENFNALHSREITVKKLAHGGKSIVVFLSCDSLTIPERHALAAMTRYFDSYTPGIRIDKDEDIEFPKMLDAFAAPIAFVDEADAYEAAEVLQEAVNLTTDVTATDEGYAVVLPNPNDFLTGFGVALIIGACYVLEKFSCSRKEKNLVKIVHDDEYDTRPWQEGIGKRYTQQQRIEDGINAILARLGDPEASGGGSVPSTLQSAARGAKDRETEALIPPRAKTSGRKSTRRPAAEGHA